MLKFNARYQFPTAQPIQGGPATIAGTVRDFTPDEIEQQRLQGQLVDRENEYKQRLLDFQKQVSEAQMAAMKAPQINAPEQRKLSGKEILLTFLGDLGAQLASNAPRSQRPQTQPSAIRLQGLRDDQYQRDLQQAQIDYQNQNALLLAQQRAAELGLTGSQAMLSEAGRQADVARDEARFGKTFGLEKAKFDFQKAYQNAGIELDRDRLNESIRQFDATEERLGRSAAEQMAANVPVLMKQLGVSYEEANKMAFAEWITAAKTSDIKDMELRRTKELYDALPVAAEVKHTLWQREAEIQKFDQDIKESNARIAQMKKSGASQSAIDPVKMLQLQTYLAGINSLRTTLRTLRGQVSTEETRAAIADILRRMQSAKENVNRNVSPGFFPDKMTEEDWAAFDNQYGATG